MKIKRTVSNLLLLASPQHNGLHRKEIFENSSPKLAKIGFLTHFFL